MNRDNSVVGFINQTAKDYDMNYSIVEAIYNKYPNSFYERLEEELIIRRKK